MSKKPQLKTETNGQITNLTLDKKYVEFKESDRGDFVIVTIGDHKVIVQDKFVHENQKTEKHPKGSYNIGIKNNFKYPIYKTDKQVTGVDLKQYYFDLHEFSKEDAKKSTVKKTPAKTSVK